MDAHRHGALVVICVIENSHHCGAESLIQEVTQLVMFSLKL